MYKTDMLSLHICVHVVTAFLWFKFLVVIVKPLHVVTAYLEFKSLAVSLCAIVVSLPVVTASRVLTFAEDVED